MFTEGLDETALNWVKQGSEKEVVRARSPLTETAVDYEYMIPKSPLSFINSPTYNNNNNRSSNLLPPLKFHSTLLGSHNLETNNFKDYYEDDDESVGSAASDDMDCTFSEGEELLNVPKQVKSTLNRGMLKDDLSVEVPQKNRNNFNESGWTSTHLSTCYGTPVADLGTPSAPPIFEESHIDDDDEVTESHINDVEKLDSSVSERETETIKSMPCGETNLELDQAPYCNSQNPWQTLITYDACFRLCLNAWARGCTEAPLFLNDECRLLRNAFGLQKLLLQPRGLKPVESSSTADKACPLKVKKVIGKIKVEVRKVRIIPQRKLKDTYSQQSAVYVHAGVEYIRHVSSLVKNKINKLGLSSFSLPCEEPVTCLLHLKSSQQHTETESGLGICLRPGTGDSHDFFPENHGDALLLEVRGEKRVIQGHAVIPVSSLHDNPPQNDRIKWWPIYHEDNQCIGKVQLSITSTVTSDDTTHLKCGPVVETLAYDFLLEAAMRAQCFHARNLWVVEPWKWLLTEFSDYYGVSESYTKLRYLSHVMNVATPIKDCLELIYQLLVPVIKARTERRLTRQEKSLLLECETQIESLLAVTFQNYKSLDESCPTGLSEEEKLSECALVAGVQLYTLIHDILSPDGQALLTNYLQAAARKRCRKHMVETDEFVATNSHSDGFLMDSVAITTAYLKMKNLCINLSDEIKTDIEIHNQHILPSSIDLSSITAAVYSTELCTRLEGFLGAWPPSSPEPHVNQLLIATADFERNLDSWNISVQAQGVDSRNLYHNYIMVWVQDMQLYLLDLCKAEKLPWAATGVITNYSTSPFAEDLYDKIESMLTQYEVVINRWPQYTLILENAVANVERAIMKALERQYADVLTPLKDSIPKRLGMQVQKLTRRQSNALYSIPNQLGTFLNSIKRIVDVLHCRIEEKLKSWASSYLPDNKKSTYGEQMNAVTVLFRTKYKTFMQAVVLKLTSNMQASRSTRLERILEETKEADGESEIRERMQVLCSQLVESISNLHEVFTNQIFIATCRGLWDKMGQIVLKFLEGRKENRVWYNGSYYALGVLDDTFASQMQRLQGNALQEKDVEPPRSILEARSILCRDNNNAPDTSTYFY